MRWREIGYNLQFQVFPKGLPGFLGWLSGYPEALCIILEGSEVNLESQEVKLRRVGAFFHPHIHEAGFTRLKIQFCLFHPFLELPCGL